jgi:hypothetical protein
MFPNDFSNMTLLKAAPEKRRKEISLKVRKKGHLRINRGSTAEVTVAQQLNQDARKKSAVYLFFLDLLVLLGQAKRT